MNDLAQTVLECLPTSTVWLLVYRDYNHEQGVRVRFANNAFYLKPFGSDGQDTVQRLDQGIDVVCRNASTATQQLYALVNAIHHDHRKMRIAYVPESTTAQSSGCFPHKSLIGTARLNSLDAFKLQLEPIVANLSHLSVHTT